MQKTSGKIETESGHTFLWILSGEKYPEIWGMLEDVNGMRIPETDGWYRTTDPEKALKLAIQNLSLKQE